MDQELGTDPELLWPLLLTQIVYDEIGKGNTKFENVPKIFAEHPLKPSTSPVIDTPETAESLYKSLLQKHEISNPTDKHAEANSLAEIYYVKFKDNLTTQIENDANEFVKVYRRFEEETNVPNEERISEE